MPLQADTDRSWGAEFGISWRVEFAASSTVGFAGPLLADLDSSSTVNFVGFWRADFDVPWPSLVQPPTTCTGIGSKVVGTRAKPSHDTIKVYGTIEFDDLMPVTINADGPIRADNSTNDHHVIAARGATIVCKTTEWMNPLIRRVSDL